MYVKVNNGAIEEYPYDLAKLPDENPNTMFPAVPTTELLESFNVFRVVIAETPVQESLTLAPRLKDQPELIDGVWTLGWETFEITQEVTEADNLIYAENMRMQRNELLSNTDWTQLADAPFTEEQVSAWAAYRQSLRDIPSHENWPRLTDDDWPTQP